MSEGSPTDYAGEYFLFDIIETIEDPRFVTLYENAAGHTEIQNRLSLGTVHKPEGIAERGLSDFRNYAQQGRCWIWDVKAKEDSPEDTNESGLLILKLYDGAPALSWIPHEQSATEAWMDELSPMLWMDLTDCCAHALFSFAQQADALFLYLSSPVPEQTHEILMELGYVHFHDNPVIDPEHSTCYYYPRETHQASHTTGVP